MPAELVVSSGHQIAYSHQAAICQLFVLFLSFFVLVWDVEDIAAALVNQAELLLVIDVSHDGVELKQTGASQIVSYLVD